MLQSSHFQISDFQSLRPTNQSVNLLDEDNSSPYCIGILSTKCRDNQFIHLTDIDHKSARFLRPLPKSTHFNSKTNSTEARLSPKQTAFLDALKS